MQETTEKPPLLNEKSTFFPFCYILMLFIWVIIHYL